MRHVTSRLARTGAALLLVLIAGRSQAQQPSSPSSTSIAAEGGDIVITAVMHASVQIEYAGKVIHVDEAEGDASKLKRGDLILVTDMHEDHMNPARIARLRKPGAPVVMPRAVQSAAGDRIPAPIEVMDNGQTRTVAGIPVETVASYNIVNTMNGEPFHTKGRANGYVITIGGKRLFFAGDTECVPEIRALKNIDVAFLPMNLPFTMPPAEAAECVKAFKPRLALPYHYQGQDPGEFMAAVKDSGIEARLLNWYPVIEVPDVVAIPRPGKVVQANQRSIHINCAGSGQPAVVLEGESGLSLDWFLVQPEVAKRTRVCSYDRSGAGWSDVNGRSGTIFETNQDLRDALAAAGEKPPFILVGAGQAALAMREYQLDFPNDVAGMVLVDALHEDGLMIPLDGKPVPAWMLSAGQLKSIFDSFRPPSNAPPPPPPPPSTDAPYDRLPADVLTTRVTFERRIGLQPVTHDSMMAAVEVTRQVAVKLHTAGANGSRPLGTRPLVVVTASSSSPETTSLQGKLAALSSNALQRVVRSSGPEIHLWAPLEVAQAIQDAVTAVRNRSALPTR